MGLLQSDGWPRGSVRLAGVTMYSGAGCALHNTGEEGITRMNRTAPVVTQFGHLAELLLSAAPCPAFQPVSLIEWVLLYSFEDLKVSF